MSINHTTELTEAEVKIGNLTFDVGCMENNKQLADIRLNGFEKWLESQDCQDVLAVFKLMVRNEVAK